MERRRPASQDPPFRLKDVDGRFDHESQGVGHSDDDQRKSSSRSPSVISILLHLIWISVCFAVGVYMGSGGRVNTTNQRDSSRKVDSNFMTVQDGHDGVEYKVSIDRKAENSGLPRNPVIDPASCGDEDLFSFLHAHGGYTNGWGFRANSSGGRRAPVAARSLKEGDIIAFAPNRATLSAYTALHSLELRPIVESVLEGKVPWVDEQVLLVLFLLHESFRRRSLYRPYLCTLPKTINLPIFWGKDQLEASLRNRSAARYAARVASQGLALIHGYENATRLIGPRPGAFPPALYTFQAWQWATAVVVSRAWSVPAPPALRRAYPHVTVLVPLLDMFDHDARRGRVLGRTAADEYIIYAGKNLTAGEEVYISYGTKCNDDLLPIYGFTVPGLDCP